jgi:hypothetical protein
MSSLSPLFNPHDPGHRTVAEWRAAGNHSWFVNAFTYALGHEEARVLLRCGGVLRLWWDAQARLVEVEEL